MRNSHHEVFSAGSLSTLATGHDENKIAREGAAPEPFPLYMYRWTCDQVNYPSQAGNPRRVEDGHLSQCGLGRLVPDVGILRRAVFCLPAVYTKWDQISHQPDGEASGGLCQLRCTSEGEFDELAAGAHHGTGRHGSR